MHIDNLMAQRILSEIPDNVISAGDMSMVSPPLRVYSGDPLATRLCCVCDQPLGSCVAEGIAIMYSPAVVATFQLPTAIGMWKHESCRKPEPTELALQCLTAWAQMQEYERNMAVTAAIDKAIRTGDPVWSAGKRYHVLEVD